MATRKEAMKWMEKGKRVYKISEAEHIYKLVNGKSVCSCGKKVNWNFCNHKDDWEIYKRPKRFKKLIVEDCPECYTRLDGDYCNNCKIGWKFANYTEGEEQ